MPAARVHLIRHGEVHNPDRVLYGRLPGYQLSERGHWMAEAAAELLIADARPIGRLVSSPLERTQQSAAPVAAAFGLTPVLDERVIEPTNLFEGSRMRGKGGALRDPRQWSKLRNPARPSWGEPYVEIRDRMLDAMIDHFKATDTGDLVIVSHQNPIWITHRAVTGAPLMHNAASRRCALSSVTSFDLTETGWLEVDYREPAAALLVGAIDLGAV